MSSSDKKSRLVYGILEFLDQSMTDGTIRADDKESMEVAIQCISESFNVEFPGDKKMSMKPASLLSVFDVYAKMADKRSTGPAASSSTDSSTATPSAGATAPPPASAADKASAEAAKVEGNRLMSKKSYDEAIAKYGEAIKLDGANPVYYSNRAAAYSQQHQHDLAITDALKAAEVDPKFAKAYSRLGHAYFSSGKYQEAVDAYERGLEIEPTNTVMKTSLNLAKTKLPSDGTTAGEDEDDVLAAMARDAPGGGAGGGGGLPGMGGMDFASMMNNPMVAQMMQQMQANGGLAALMNDPNMRQMAENMMGGGGGGQGPDLASLMNNPMIRNLAQQFGQSMGGGGAGGGGSGGAGGRNNSGDMYS